jgi:hypothetical protein
MDKSKEPALSRSNFDNDVPTYDEVPAYEAGTSSSAGNALGTTLTIDPTGTSIIELPLGGGPPVYTFSSSLLHVHSLSPGVDVSRPDPHSGESIPLYSVAERFIAPLQPVQPLFKNVTAVRSSGLAAAIGLRKIVWDFSTQVPIPVDKSGKIIEQGIASGDSVGVYLMTLGPDGIGVQKDLLRFFDGKWVAEDDEVLAIAREGGAECEGMPVLSVIKKLDQGMMDFLIAAWCVTLWGELHKRTRHHKHT